MKARTSLWASLAIAASIGLAGCGGSSNEKKMDDDMKPTEMQLADERRSLSDAADEALDAAGGLIAVTPTEKLIDALEDAIDDLKDAIDAVKYGSDTTAANKALRRAEAALASAMTEKGKIDQAATDDANKDRIANAKALLGNDAKFELGLLGFTGRNKANNQAKIDIDSEGLIISVDANNDDTWDSNFPAIKKTTTTVPSLGGWGGAEYMITDPEKPTTSNKLKTTDHAKVYSNQEADEDKAFNGDLSGLGAPTAAGAYTVDTDTAAIRKHITSSKFPSGSGIQTYTGDDRKFEGAFRGAMGTYECTGNSCTAKIDGNKASDGFILAGTWTFTPKGGATLKQSDDDYLFFGWWMRTDEDGMPTWASAFYGTRGTNTDFGEITETANNPEGIGGSAKYNGKATGQFAINESIRGSGDSGEFTADVALTATFSESHDGNTATSDTGGVTGTINGFMANGKPMPSWSVELKRAGWGGSSNLGAFGEQGGNDAPDSKTVWSIDGNAAAAGGMWEGRLYGDDSDDTNNTPTTAIGVFQAEAGETHRMVGGFGANIDIASP